MPRNLDELHQLSAYRALRQSVALRTSPLVAVVGAGLSAPAGVPTWAKLRAHLVEELRGKASRELGSDSARKLAEQADEISAMSSYWAAFARLESLLGKTTYRAEIRNKISVADARAIPDVYARLWRAPVQGVLTLNLDNFVKRSFSQVAPGVDLKWFVGKDASRLTHLLHSQHRFAYSLHGSVDDAESWVFTHDDLRSLYRQPGYKEMLSNIFSGYTVLFLGVSADDTAIGGPLEKLASRNVDGRPHYWLTDRSDAEADRWAEGVGVRLLPYDSAKGHEIVSDVLGDLTTAVAEEVEAPPVVLALAPESEPLPEPDILVTRPLSEVRELLNRHAFALLAGPGGEAEFDGFVAEYEEVVHRAWFVSASPGRNNLFGYTLQEQVAKGAFGRVFRAVDSKGEAVAVKLLRTEIASDAELLRSFRRGVRAMRILETHGVPGMVAYKDATEIPAFVSMEWVEGPNLAQAKDSGLLSEWDAILWVALRLVETLKMAHDLPEGVLHRDVRPANVMLRHGWTSTSHLDWDLVLLDFDLSTFRGAREKSVLAEGSALGFLAPEQLEKLPYSTRNAAVDSFGVGMTLLFLCAGREPEAYSQRRADFPELVRRATRELQSPEWKSVPHRFERLILGATRDRQSDRWDVAQILRELRRLDAALTDRAVEADLLADEIASRCPGLAGLYEWNLNDDAVEVSRPGGLRLTIIGAPESDSLSLTMSWGAIGVEDRGNVAKYLPERSQRAAAALRGGPWEGVKFDVQRQSMTLSASLAVDRAQRRIDDAAHSLDRAMSALQFVDV